MLIQTYQNISGLAQTKQQTNNEFSDVFSGIGCLEGTFKLQEKDGSRTPSTSEEGNSCTPGTT